MLQLKRFDELVKGIGIVLIGWMVLSQALGYETRTIQAEMMRHISGIASPAPCWCEGWHAMWVTLNNSSSMARLAVPIRPLPPGSYKIFGRLSVGTQGDWQSVNCRVWLSYSGGGSSSPVSFALSDCVQAGNTFEGLIFQAPVTISTGNIYDILHLELTLSSGWAYVLIDWVLITDDPSIVIRNNPCDPSRKEFVRVSDSPTLRLIPAGSTNAFPNSSFEAGDVYWLGPYQWDFQIFSSMIDNTYAYHGQCSLKLIMFTPRQWSNPAFSEQTFGSPELKGFAVQAGRTYTFSFWVYHEIAAEVRVALSIKYIDLDCCPGSCETTVRQDFTVPAFGWTPVWVSGGVPSGYGRAAAIVSFEIGTSAGDAYSMFPVWIDAMQFHEGSSPLPYEPARSIEAGLHFAEPGNVVVDGSESSQIRLSVRKESSLVRGYFEYRVYDFFNRLVVADIVNLSALPAGSHDLPLVSDLPRGWFEVHYRTVIEGQPAPEFSRVHFTVVPPALGDTPIGGYGVTGPVALRIYNLSNLRWQNLYSASNYIQYWSWVEPNDDDWRLYPHRVQWAQTHGVNLIFTFALGTSPRSEAPSWAWRGDLEPDPPGDPRPDREPYNPNIHVWHRIDTAGHTEYFRIEDWQDYVRTMVHNYKFWIKYWQVIDEPMLGFTPAEYLKLLRATYQAVKEEDPSAIVLASPYFHLNDLLSVDPNMAQYCDGIYEYLGRNRAYTYFVRLWALLNRRRIVAIDFFPMRSGWYDILGSLNYPGEVGNFKGYTLKTVQEIALNALQNLTWSGAERCMIYDMRFPGSLGDMTCFEPDGTWKPIGVLLACMSAVLSGYVGVDELGTGDTLRAFWFRSRFGSTSLFAVVAGGTHPWMPTGELRWITLPSASFTALDAFGNPAPRDGNRVLIGSLPTYIIVLRANETLFKRALIQQSLTKPVRAYQVLGSWVEWRGDRFVLVTRIRNNTPWTFMGDAYVFPHGESNSLYHLYNYNPVYTRAWYAATAIAHGIVISPGGVVDIEFPLEYGHDALYKNPILSFYYPLYIWLVPSGTTILPFGEIYTSLFWF